MKQKKTNPTTNPTIRKGVRIMDRLKEKIIWKLFPSHMWENVHMRRELESSKIDLMCTKNNLEFVRNTKQEFFEKMLILEKEKEELKHKLQESRKQHYLYKQNKS